MIATPLSSPQKKAGLSVFYLCGDALYSLFHPETSPLWVQLGSRPEIRIYADSEDLADIGLLRSIPELETVQIGDRSVLFSGVDGNPVSSVGFLHLYSPYKDRHTDLFLGLVRQAVDLSLPLSVILYLDGVHLCHRNQITTEFTNIEQGLDLIRKKASDTGVRMIVTACQRCSQARGYLHGQDNDMHAAPCFRNEVEISGLSNLIPYFTPTELVLSADCADVSGGDKEAYIHIITGSPYGTEHTFGAISWAVALAGKNIPSDVVFVEDGVYAWIPTPDSRIRGSVRDIQAVIEATAIPGLLEYFILDISLSKRGIHINEPVLDIQVLRLETIASLKEKLIAEEYHVRVLIW